MSSGVQSGQAFSVEFATPQYICPCGYVLVTADDTQQYPDSKPRNWTLEAKNSQDGDWVVLARVSDDTSLPSANCAALSMPIANVQEYCYFRLTFNGVGGGDTFQLSDFYLLISGGARDCTITFDPQGGGAIADGNARNRENMALAAAPVRMGYDFLGWNTAWDGGGTRYAAGAEYFATGDATLYAEWEAQTREVRWLNWNGAQLAASSVKTGRMPVYTGPAPTKPPENMLKAYEFSGWSPEVKAVSGTDSVITYTAQFREVVRTFTVTWKNYDGTVLETDRRVAYGTATSYESMTPVKTSTAAQDFTFSSWSPAVAPTVTDDVTYTATFTAAPRNYTVTWKNWDGTVLKTDRNVAYDSMPSYGGAIPTRTAPGPPIPSLAGRRRSRASRATRIMPRTFPITPRPAGSRGKTGTAR